MLTGVHFKNFKALADVAIKLERLTVLVGANATGKTTVLEGIDAVCQVARPVDLGEQGIARLFSGRLSPDDLLNHRKLTEEVCVEVSGSLDLGLRFEPEPVVTRKKDGQLLQQFEIIDGPKEWNALQAMTRRARFPIATRAGFELAKLAEPSVAAEDLSRVSADGSGLASAIAELLLTRSSSLDRIQEELVRLVPRARRLRAPPATIKRVESEVIVINGQSITNRVERTHRGHRLELELEDVGFVPAHMLSEGTLLLIGLLTLLHTSKPPHVFLLDDLDRGLHPKAQRIVVEALRRFIDEDLEVQIVCTTHSPYALDCFRPEEVRVMKIDRRGRSHCRELTEHPDWGRWSDFMKAGEFWSSVGEDWVFGEEDAG